jgi:ketosteroid isomerase-like protein
MSDRDQSAVAAAMQQINNAWLSGHVDDLVPLVHPDIVMVVPGFAARSKGRDAFVAGFREFCNSARVHEFREHDAQVDVAGRTAIVVFVYEIVYERQGGTYRGNGRDLWVFERSADSWIAVWRTMLDISESAVSEVEAC